MLSYVEMVDRMRTAAQHDALGEYAASIVRDELFSQMKTNTAAMLKPCLTHLAQNIELACPATMAMTKSGMISGYGITVQRPGEICIAVANLKRAIVFTVTPSVDFKPTLDHQAALWPAMSRALDVMAKSKTAKTGLSHITAAILSRMGQQEMTSLLRSTADLNHARAPLIMLIACVCGIKNEKSAGGLIVMPMPAVLLDEQE